MSRPILLINRKRLTVVPQPRRGHPHPEGVAAGTAMFSGWFSEGCAIYLVAIQPMPYAVLQTKSMTILGGVYEHWRSQQPAPPPCACWGCRGRRWLSRAYRRLLGQEEG